MARVAEPPHGAFWVGTGPTTDGHFGRESDGYMLSRLKEYGFSAVTAWRLKDGRIRLASLDWADRSGWLYAFVVNEEVKYIGLSTRVLRSRMDNYRDQVGDQNQRLREAIKGELVAGREVIIYGRPEPNPERLGIEEEQLRIEFRPEWNRM